MLHRIGLALLGHKGGAGLESFCCEVLSLLPGGHRILETCHEHLIVNVVNGFSHQLLTIKFHRIGVTMIDKLP